MYFKNRNLLYKLYLHIPALEPDSFSCLKLSGAALRSKHDTRSYLECPPGMCQSLYQIFLESSVRGNYKQERLVEEGNNNCIAEQE